MHDLDLHQREAYVLNAHPFDSNVFLSAGYDGQLIIWSLATGVPLNIFHEGKLLDLRPADGILGHKQKFTDSQFSPDGNELMASDKDGFLTLYGTEDTRFQKV